MQQRNIMASEMCIIAKNAFDKYAYTAEQA
jgi:hypothetical protein